MTDYPCVVEHIAGRNAPDDDTVDIERDMVGNVNGSDENSNSGSNDAEEDANRVEVIFDNDILGARDEDREGVQGFTVSDLRNSIVSHRTNMHYVHNIIDFLSFCFNHGTDRYRRILTDEGNEMMRLNKRVEGEGMRAHKRRSFLLVDERLRYARENPIVFLTFITPEVYMNYLLLLRHRTKGTYKSKSAYGTHRASLFHLFRKHNSIGYSIDYRAELTNLFRGFDRNIAQTRHGGNDNDDGTARTVGTRIGRAKPDEGREPMSVELLKKLLEWFWEYNTCDGVFAHCYLIMTWVLMCRSENTALIKLSDIAWSTSFDCFQVFFSHSKTDQVGDEARHPRHIYANSVLPLLCPVTSLSFYLSCCFNTQNLTDHSFLFPGPHQEVRFSRMLARLLRERAVEIRQLGYEIDKIGTHSIRKGASTYLTSLPGGPPAVAIMLRSGWSMGNVKDRYFRYMEAGDQYCGRCLSLHSVLSVELASSPPFFDVTSSEDALIIADLSKLQFPAVANVACFGKLLRMCLASILYHH